MKKYYLLLAIITLLFTTGCYKPYQVEKFQEIQPNETAFVLPLEGANLKNQKKLSSVKYLDSMKVAAKRIIIPTRFHQTGRKNRQGKWINTVKIITVDRSPITREWTAEKESGTETKNQAIKAESKESIEFSIGVTLTASILEDDAAKFLYYYAGKSLANVIDANCRSYVQGIITGEFAKYNLGVCRGKKKEVFDKLYTSAKTKFKEKGITIDFIGAAGGLVYTDPQIQTAINDKFAAEMQKKAETDKRIGAQEFAKAAGARKKQIELEIMKMNAEANLERAKRWDGKLPANILPAGMSGGFLMNMGGK